ncbi:acyl-CoA dehydrogenase family protein [Streptomyces sp. RerS4]|uniref:acyl-CoA dehydrogenase family protein n=1 Tax=Streptomyces sp. RerS4 TaxID=2942449 RepID=UPI00201C0501|nr:acyl-CoA dehydrogenase family protein [Streptomyces sp. RerS4]UQX05469.1 hydrolase [Streptomyces sp. RerS4]
MPSRPTSSTGLLTKARELRCVAARYAARTDTTRTLPAEVAEGIAGAGFAAHLVPAHRGGRAGSASELLHAVSAVAQGCTSTAWCAAALAEAAHTASHLPEAGQRELWANGPDTALVGAGTPQGSATEVAGGWRVTGEWAFVAGAALSTWALVVARPADRGRSRPWTFALPRDDYRVRDGWTSMGLRGAGGDVLSADNVFVPAHRAFPPSDDERRPAGQSHLPAGLVHAACALGAARAALRVWTEDRAMCADPRDPHLRTTLARTAAAVDGAALLLERAARIADTPSTAPLDLVRLPADCSHAAGELVAAVGRLFGSAGRTARVDDHPLQRLWRDTQTLAGHPALSFDTVGAAYGGRLLEGVHQAA